MPKSWKSCEFRDISGHSVVYILGTNILVRQKAATVGATKCSQAFCLAFWFDFSDILNVFWSWSNFYLRGLCFATSSSAMFFAYTVCGSANQNNAVEQRDNDYDGCSCCCLREGDRGDHFCSRQRSCTFWIHKKCWVVQIVRISQMGGVSGQRKTGDSKVPDPSFSYMPFLLCSLWLQLLDSRTVLCCSPFGNPNNS